MNRRDIDMGKLMSLGFNVEPINESIHRFHVYFSGPANSLYSGGVWKVMVNLTETYPYESPLVHFVTPIYHSNIHLLDGGICVNLLDDQWDSAFDLVTVFGMILPQLLMEPKASDPINQEAANLLLEDRPAYEVKVREYRDRYANPGE